MQTAYQQLCKNLPKQNKTWLVTGAAGFIGSNLTEKLLALDQQVVGIDNFATGKKENLIDLERNLTIQQRGNFRFIEGDISEKDVCLEATKGIDIVLHQAAIGSVPRSLENPVYSHNSNVNGFVLLLDAAVKNKVKRLVYASSSSVYGDDPRLPKVEENIGTPLSPYAVTKRVDEIYAQNFSQCYGLQTIGLRYFNVFGRRQDPYGAYSAVIPRWLAALFNGDNIKIYGDGLTSRDFCYIDNTVQLNLLAALTTQNKAFGEVFNCAYADTTSLNDLLSTLTEIAQVKPKDPVEYLDFRPGDITHSFANIDKSKRLLNYTPSHSLSEGLKETLQWYKNYFHH